MIDSMTHQGLIRDKNEDRFLIKEYGNGKFLIAVADGMGGEAAGELAAHIAIESLGTFNPESQSILEDLVEFMRHADRLIMERVKENEDLKGMGTTMTTVFKKETRAYWAHVGDTRFSVYRDNKLEQITEDHTPPGFLLTDGEITREEARVHPLRHVLFECLGCGDFQADRGIVDLMNGDLLLLSTDGLHDEVPEETIVSILDSSNDLQARLQAFVSAALDSGGKDNITVVGAQI